MSRRRYSATCRVIIRDFLYKGQPVFKEINETRTRCTFLSWEIKTMKDDWCIFRWVTLGEVKLDHRQTLHRRLKDIDNTINELKTKYG